MSTRTNLLRKAADAIYLVVDKGCADEVSEMLRAVANEVDKMEDRIAELEKENSELQELVALYENEAIILEQIVEPF